MASAQQLADRALVIARQCLDAHRGELLILAEGDSDLVRLAAARVRSMNIQRPETDRTAEHLAFSLLTAAFADVIHQRDDGRGAVLRPQEP